MSWEEILRRERAEKLLAEALEATPMEGWNVGTTHATGDVTLVCGHDLHFDHGTPHKKEIVWCQRCREYQNVEQVHTGKAFRVSCEQEGCRFTRGKEGKLQAERSAVSHRIRHPHHSVVLTDATGTIVQRFADSEAVTTLPDIPPF